MEHLSSDMKQQNQVQELYSKGYSQREISQTLQVGLASVKYYSSSKAILAL
jgi:transposase